MVGTELSNKAGVTLIGNWKLEGVQIRNADDATKGFGVVNDDTTAGTEVNFNEILSANNTGQQWKFGLPDSSDYFTIMNPASDKFLTAVTADRVTIECKW